MPLPEHPDSVTLISPMVIFFRLIAAAGI